MFDLLLLVATFLCALIAGFLFAFAVVAMPGIAKLGDREFLRAFQVMDGIIQDRQPLFMVVWIGSVVALIAAVATGVGQLAGIDRLLLIVAAVAYLIGVQLPTMVVNIPLNNRIQTLDVATMDDAARATSRRAFEPTWNRWNAFRTAFAMLTTGLLLAVLS